MLFVDVLFFKCLVAMVPGMLWMLLFACLVPASSARGELH